MSSSPPRRGISQRNAYAVQAAFLKLHAERLTPSEIAAAVGISAATAHRALQAGCELGTFATDDRGLYWPGESSAMLSMRWQGRTPDPDATLAALEQLHSTTLGLACYYAAKGNASTLLHYVTGSTDVSGLNPLALASVGSSLRTGASGRAILAHSPLPLRTRVLAEPVPRKAGPGAIRSDAELLASLEEIRRRGYAVGIEECILGWASVAAPVTEHNTALGAVLLLVPITEMPDDPSALAAHTMQTAKAVSTFF
ncbi:IclR family transcriptional regulator [Streptomyces sp. ISL-11]|uniref:IclR family transcriptional regulator n=1 Tax=Streptomyces sp. ISL-11 TaxID=2819174 RepID=UPI001BE8E302|nr:IclR family transcriptional regulator C-terminal domain-containing protein [Streptomyces sp. ISL-11]MBT2383884.1 IclR family transcriptional regulator [Streptomyces sp. ISL-11]